MGRDLIAPHFIGATGAMPRPGLRRETYSAAIFAPLAFSARRTLTSPGTPRSSEKCPGTPSNIFRCDQARSKRSRFINLVQAATKSRTNFACASSDA